MCYVIYHVHAECRHDKKADIVEACEDFERGPCILIPLHFKQVTAPSLCPTCFREEEARIDDEYHTRVKWIRSKMAEHEAAQADRQIRGRAQGLADSYVAMLERELASEKESRDRKIRAFRSEQDVWADG
ncbi:MAG: hypothetical protein ALECFALPRED_000953 [Alectoria fallacina]|uniref:Uncharacterized protein n=1 Tax=Alectoria fallacina TaxID=1903189 RepID=A0A8H3PKP3_9LECA|nr:MAG: hypothetical protein ALECFALPRED_000953 [Alectoria fallacina]